MATCGLCESKGIHGHWALKRSIQDEFRSELMRAQHEYQRLLALFREVTWYHFELLARKWRTPWHVTWPDTSITLYGVDTQLLQGNRYITNFPLYYNGPVELAPQCPPEVLTTDLEEARQTFQFWEREQDAMYDWAPGGVEYRKLLCTTSLPTQLKRRRISNTHCEDGRSESPGRKRSHLLGAEAAKSDEGACPVLG